MSLFLGNLSPRIRRDELERVFQRFGRNNVQLKDGYGFVVYDLPANAEKALRALRGKKICGEPISLTWANKQPRPSQRFTRGSRFYEPYHTRNFPRGEDYGMRKTGSHDRQELKMITKHLDGEGGKPHMDDLLDKETGHNCDNIEDRGGEKCHSSKEGLLDEGVSVEPNLVDNDRWGEAFSGPLYNDRVDNGMDFDRYEPYHGYEKGNEDESHQMTGSHGSPAQGSSREKAWRERTGNATMKNPGNSKPQQICYICGLMGHVMRNCPRVDLSRQNKFTRFDSRRDNDASFRGKGEGGLKRLRHTSWGRSNSSGGPPLSRRIKNDRKSSGSGKRRRLVSESSPVTKETRRSQLKSDSQRKKKHKREHGFPKKYRGRKGRSGSSPPHSHSTASSSRSRLLSSETSSYSRSRSVSSRTQSATSSLRSMSMPSYSKSKRSRSRSRSSSPTSLSLSITLGQPLPSSPNKAQMEDTGTPKGYLGNDTIPKSKHLLVEQGQLTEGDASSENSKLKGKQVMPDANTLSSFKVEDEMKKDHLGQRDDDGNYSTYRIEYEVKHPCTTPSGEGAFLADNSPSENSEGRRDHQKSGPLAMEHTQPPPGKLNPEVPATSQIIDSIGISSQEMCMVLKHYGLAMPEENEKILPVEAYFGSARLWPWEIIYYRRLKKGPISTENYARRVAQNKEFSIVDKYIRSSSGWGDCDQNIS